MYTFIKMNKKNKWYIKKSSIHGKGVFAGIDLMKGDLVDYLNGSLIKIRKDEVNKVFPSSSENWIGIDINKWIDPKLPFVAINHSCNPNVGIQGRKSFRVIKDVKKDEELVFDYSISEVDLQWEMKCNCNNSNCRKEIRSIQSLPRKVLKSYLPCVPTVFLKIYDKHKK